MLQLIALAGAFHLHLAPAYRATLSAEQARTMDEFLARAELVLPRAMKDALARDFEVSFAPMSGLAQIEEAACPSVVPKPLSTSIVDNQDSAFVKTEGETILLNEAFAPEILKGEAGSQSYRCGHGNFYRLAEAKLIHALAHFYDNASTVPGVSEIDWTDRASQPLCREQGNGIPLYVNEKPLAQCSSLEARGGSYSGQDRFLDVAGFGPGLNQVQPRTPDLGEFAGPRESFATQLEYFLLDPEFACRRPTMAATLSELLGESRPCLPNPVVGVARDSGAAFSFESLDPSRIYEVQFILASPGSDTASRFGHAMLKLVRCAPTRAEVGPDCRADIASHLVVSYRANIHGFTVSDFSGLMGTYPAELFVEPFLDVIAEYNRGELRDLMTLPLKLTDAQKDRLVERVLEQYWTYNDRYYFLTNNCAAGVLELLRAALPGTRLGGKTPGIVSPDGLYEILGQVGLLDPSLKDAAGARGRYFFPALDTRLEASFEALLGMGALPQGSTLKSYVESTSAASRRAAYEAFRSTNPALAPRAALGFYAIEMLAQQSTEAKGKGDLSNWLARQPTQELVELSEERVPWNFARRGYGIPLTSELPAPDALNASLQKEQELVKELENSAPANVAADRAELSEISANLRFFIVEASRPR